MPSLPGTQRCKTYLHHELLLPLLHEPKLLIERILRLLLTGVPINILACKGGTLFQISLLLIPRVVKPMQRVVPD